MQWRSCFAYYLPLTYIKAFNWISGETATLCLHLSFAKQQASFLQERIALGIIETLGTDSVFTLTTYTRFKWTGTVP